MANNSIMLNFEEWAAHQYVVSPEQAQYWLDNHNTANRSIRPTHAQFLARQMALGYWNPDTHEGIAFAPDGSLVDGQHRLLAITIFKRPVKMLIWTGIKPEAKLVIGDGARRTAADSLKLAGHEVTRNMTGTLRQMLDGFNITKRGERPSTSELEELYLAHADAVNFAHKHLPPSKNVPMNAGIRGAVARAYYHVNVGMLETFCESYLALQHLDGRNCSAPITLRTFMIKNAGKLGSGKSRNKVYRITENMIQRFMNGENVQLVKGSNKEFFPLPEKHVARAPRAPVVMRRRGGEAAVRVEPGNGRAATGVDPLAALQ